ncbi:MAG: deoxyribodipyrimidine photo-lyase/cryptochrome family protein [Casimicrobiaceae bacterium]
MLYVVWFKRDLRLHDHAPLMAAAQAVREAAGAGARLLALWLDEPGYWRGEEVSPRQRAWLMACAADLDRQLRRLGGRLHGLALDAPEAFARLHAAVGQFTLFSHEETGNAWTYARDRAVARLCREHGIRFREWPNGAVVRRLDSRNRWSAHWLERMSAQPLVCPDIPPQAFAGLPAALAPFACDFEALAPTLLRALGAALVTPGRKAAEAALSRFLDERLAIYRRGMSAPGEAPLACSLLSAHFAAGTLSIREAVHALWAERARVSATAPSPEQRAALEGMKSLEARLHWHCHFIQKLESAPELEHENLHRGYDGLRNQGTLGQLEQERFRRWAEGLTGWPMVDACMRALAATGWLNFRMRAMLMSIAAYPLWLHWRTPGVHLARLFVDYEPGIHWPQVQMQAGTTGINAVRIYDPTKQGLDHDPEGEFIRKWVPELRDLPQAFIHRPWLAPVPPRDYPPPLVEWAAAAREAAHRIHHLRREAAVQAEAVRVYDAHGSRHPGREGRPRARGRRPPAADPAQASLF